MFSDMESPESPAQEGSRNLSYHHDDGTSGFWSDLFTIMPDGAIPRLLASAGRGRPFDPHGHAEGVIVWSR